MTEQAPMTPAQAATAAAEANRPPNIDIPPTSGQGSVWNFLTGQNPHT